MTALVIGNNLQAQPMPPGGGGTNYGVYTNIYSPLPYVPGLKLDVLSPSGTNLFINLLEADPVGTYDIFAASNLVSATWNDILAGTNGQTNFTLPFRLTDMAFFRAARTDTPVTNTAGMTASFPNNPVNTNLISAMISGGPAAALAVLVNDTNLADAVWVPFSAVPYVLLGTNDGTYQVEFGYIGSDGQTNWTSASVALDTTPPLLFITGQTNGIVTQPMIQLTGYSPEAVINLSCDVSNIAGVWTNQPVLVVDQYFDTNLWIFTTNTFQAFDIPLTNELNAITIRATDLAGNLTTLATNFTVDYSGKTNPPVVQLIWPPNGAQLAGSNFTARGWVDDYTATVTASITDADGAINTFIGLVERNGYFWVEDLPVTGTNAFTLTITDAAGNMCVTNLNVTASTVTVTMNPVGDDQLNRLTTSVSGWVSDASYAVWVNGIPAPSPDGDGNWSVDNVPVPPGGTAVFSVAAYPADEAPSSAPAPFVNPQTPHAALMGWTADKPPQVYVQSYEEHLDSATTGYKKLTLTPTLKHDILVWQYGVGTTETYHLTMAMASEPVQTYWDWLYDISWPADTWTPSLNGTETLTLDEGNGPNTSVQTIGPPDIEMAMLNFQASGQFWNSDDQAYLTASLSMSKQTVLRYFTGGKSLPQRFNLHRLNATLNPTAITSWGLQPGAGGGPWSYLNISNGLTNGITAGVFGNLTADGTSYRVLPDGQDFVITPAAQNITNYNFSADVQKYKLHILANDYPLADDRIRPLAYYCVGQKLNFRAVFSPAVSGLDHTEPIWNYTADYVNNHWTDANDCEEYNIAPIPAMSNPTVAWFYNKQTQDATANLGLYCKFNNGQSAYLVRHGNFNIFTPSITFIPGGSATVNVRHYGAAVEFGIGDDVGVGGMGFSANINSIPKFEGHAIATQLINRQASIDSIPFGTGGTNDLDNTEIYSEASLTNDPINPHSNLLGTVFFLTDQGFPLRQRPGRPATITSKLTFDLNLTATPTTFM